MGRAAHDLPRARTRGNIRRGARTGDSRRAARATAAARRSHRQGRGVERTSGGDGRRTRGAAQGRQRRGCGSSRLVRPRRRGAGRQWARRLRPDDREPQGDGPAYAHRVHDACSRRGVSVKRRAPPPRRQPTGRAHSRECARHARRDGTRVAEVRQSQGDVGRRCRSRHSRGGAGVRRQRRAGDDPRHRARTFPEVSGKPRAVLPERQGARIRRYAAKPGSRPYAAHHCRQRSRPVLQWLHRPAHRLGPPRPGERDAHERHGTLLRRRAGGSRGYVSRVHAVFECTAGVGWRDAHGAAQSPRAAVLDEVLHGRRGDAARDARVVEARAWRARAHCRPGPVASEAGRLPQQGFGARAVALLRCPARPHAERHSWRQPAMRTAGWCPRVGRRDR